MTLNLGKTTFIKTIMTSVMTMRIIKIIHVIDDECVKALINAPIPIIGANNTILNNIIINI